MNPIGSRLAIRMLWALIATTLTGGVAAAVVVGSGPETVSAAALADRVKMQPATTGVTAMDMTTVTEIDGQGRQEIRMSMLVDNASGNGLMATEFVEFPAPVEPQQALLTSDRMYFSIPEALRGRPGPASGKSWVSAPFDRRSMMSTDPFGGDPRTMFSSIDDEAEVVGRAQVRGASTTHYKMAIDYAELVAAGQRQQQAFGALPMGAPGLAFGDATMEVWLDDEGAMRRLRIRAAVSFGEQSGTVTTQQEVYPSTEAVAFDVPPADQVHEAASVADAQRVIAGQ